MILEQLVKDIITEEHNKVKKEVPWDGMFDKISERIVKEIREEIVR